MVNKYSRILIFSIFLSVFVHIGALFYLQKYFLSFYRTFFAEKVVKKEKFFSSLKEEDILFLTFEKNKKASLIKRSVKGLKCENEKGIELQKYLAKIPMQELNLKTTYKVNDLLKEEPLVEDIEKYKKSSYRKKYFDNGKNLISFLKNNLPEIPKKETKALVKTNFFLKREPKKNFKVVSKTLFLKEKPLAYQTDFKKRDENIFKFLRELKRENLSFDNTKRKKVFLPFLPHIPSLEELDTISCGEDFLYNVEYIPRKDGVGFIFALVLIPKPTNKFERVKQNFYFLIDRSNSIQSQRLTMTRHAVASAITHLNKKDSFNILTFNKKVTPLFPQNQNPTARIVNQTRSFLRTLTLGTFFSSSNFFLPLNHILQNPKKENEINNIILISNGEGLDKFKNRNLIREWTKTNQGKQSFYTVSLERDKNISVLDLFSSMNRGKLITSSTLRGLKRHLIRLVKSLNYPIAKNVHVSLYEEDNTQVILYPPKSQKKHFYLNDPYVIIGSVKELKDFTLFIQGRNPKTWFNIKKRITFKDAKLGGRALEEKWALYKANRCFEFYLRDGNVKYIKMAKEILKPYNLKPAFQ
jgi:hypothetical protein